MELSLPVASMGDTADRQTKAWRLSQLGWTQDEIAARLGVAQSVISADIGKSEIGEIDNSLGENWNEKSVAEWANRMQVTLTDATVAARRLLPWSYSSGG